MERPRSEGCAYWSGIARQIARSGYFDFAFSPSSTSGRMVSEGARSKATCLLKSEPLGPPTRILLDRPGVRLTAIDSKRPFLGSVAGRIGRFFCSLLEHASALGKFRICHLTPHPEQELAH